MREWMEGRIGGWTKREEQDNKNQMSGMKGFEGPMLEGPKRERRELG